MHCQSCDAVLTDFEATRKNKKTGMFLDLCGECATFLPVSSVDMNDLLVMELDRGIIDTMDSYEE